MASASTTNNSTNNQLYRLSKFVVITDGATVGRPGSYFAFSTRTGRVEEIESSLFLLLQHGTEASANPEVLIRLRDSLLVVPEGSDELAEVILENTIAVRDSQELYLPIMATAACQLACGYCGQDHGKHQTSPELARLIADFLKQKLQSGRYSSVRLGIYGGEPLIAYRWLRELGVQLDAIRKEWPDLPLSSKLVTNGVSATKDKLQTLVYALNVNAVEVTIDGPRAIQASQRASLRGQDFFEKILENLLSYENLVGVQVSIRCNVTSASAEYVEELLDELASKGFPRFTTIYFVPVHSWGNNAHQAALLAEEFSYLELKWRLRALELGWKIRLLPQRKPIVCSAVKPHAAVVAPDGKIFECTEMPLVPMYRSRSIGNLATHDDLSPVTRAFSDFNKQVATNLLPCSKCFALPVCGGACPKEWLEGREPCPSFKRNAEFALRAWLNIAYQS